MEEPARVAIADLLAWYDRHRRRLPWRAQPGEQPDPYRVWLSEIMLQQTTVTAVIPYFNRFLTAFPEIRALAAAPSAAVMQAWAGLGYYARARNLHRAAGIVTAAGGAFPNTAAALRQLPGIGAYTATAIAAIGFGVPGIPIDGNVERVLSRIGAIVTPLPTARPAIAALARQLETQPEAQARPSDTAQALFDLGATLCTPAAPACGLCPWQRGCAGLAAGIAATLPVRPAKKPLPIRYGAVFHLRDQAGQVLLQLRPPRGLLGGMNELPGTAWRDTAWSEPEMLAAAPRPAAWRRVGQIRHVFTHFTLLLDIYAGEAASSGLYAGEATSSGLYAGEAASSGPGFWTASPETASLPSLMRKCLTLVERKGALQQWQR